MSSDADVAVTNPNSRQSPRDFPDAMTGRAAYCGARLETIRPGRATVQTAKETDVDQVVAAATDYLTSFYSGTAEERRARIHKVLYPDLVKRAPAYMRSSLMLNISYSEMGRIAERSVHEDRPIPYSVEVLDVTPRMASVRTDADWGVDYIHLAKLDGDWKVVNVLWDGATGQEHIDTI